MKIPKTLGAVADLLYKTRQARLAKQKEVEALEAEESALKEHIIANLPKSNASGIAGKVARVSVANKSDYRVTDWSALYKYIKKHDAFALLQRRLSTESVTEVLEDSKELPGVETIQIPKVSLNKL